MSRFKTYSLRNFQISSTELLVIPSYLTFPGFIYFIAEHLPLTLSPISPPAPDSPASGYGQSALCVCELAFPFVLCHTVRIVCYLSFCLLSFSILPSKSTSSATNGKISLFTAKSVVLIPIFSLSICQLVTLRPLPYLGVTVVNTAAVKWACACLFEMSSSFSSVKYSQAELLDHMTVLFLMLRGAALWVYQIDDFPILPPFCRLPLHFVVICFAVQKLFSLKNSQCKGPCHYFSSWSSVVQVFTFGVSFCVFSIRRFSSFSFLYVTVRFPPNHPLKTVPSLHTFLAPLLWGP